MAGRADGAVVLLPIRPRYADPIMSGAKRIEFRRRRFARPTRWVIVYSSAPVQRVVGFFSVGAVEVDEPDRLWQHHRTAGCIAEDDFAEYFRGCLQGVAIHVEAATRLAVPLTLAELGQDPRPPQSYKYLDVEALARLQARAATY